MMNRRIVQLIAGREIRDLLRDRRSVILLIVLPILLYPGIGVIGFLFALSQMDHVSKIGVSGLEHLPTCSAEANADPALIVNNRFAVEFCESAADSAHLEIHHVAPGDPAALADKSIHAWLVIPEDFRAKLAEDSATVEIRNRDGDEISKLATHRLSRVLRSYAGALKKARFARRGLPEDYDVPLVIREPQDAESMVQRASSEVRDQLAKFIPFMLVMWALAGALHPAIDLCAGEKERGTMETLLISPVDRREIVAGKFLAVWFYATLTAWWNLLWMAALCLIGPWLLSRWGGDVEFIRLISLVICFPLTLPMTALFASLALALGAYARSTKEGQYYLLPLFLAVMPLVMLSMAPNADLTLGMSLIPVTGFCLMLQKMIGPTPWAEVLPYFIPMVASLTVCVLAASWWAVRQFHREEVLFRESDNSAIRGWLSSFSDKPTSQ